MFTAKADADFEWYRNLQAGDFDDDNVVSAMWAASIKALGTGGPIVPVLTEFFSGHFVEGENGARVLESFTETFPEFNRLVVNHDEDAKETASWRVARAGAVRIAVNRADSSLYCQCAVTDKGVLERMLAWTEAHVRNVPPVGTVYMMTSTQSGPVFHSVGIGGAEYIADNYTPFVQKAYERIKTELRTPTPKGRLTIVSGTPGSGKTYLVKSLLNDVANVRFAIVPQHVLGDLVGPSGIAALTKLQSKTPDEGPKPIVLILEDADDALAPRQQGDTSAISSLLNLGDGIVGSVLDIRIIATTNRDKQDFDKAVLRPGRLSTSIQVNKVDTEQASRIYTRLTGNRAVENNLDGTLLFPRGATLAEIYQKAFDSEWAAQEGRERKMGFGA
jgi:hypothetical protein